MLRLRLIRSFIKRITKYFLGPTSGKIVDSQIIRLTENDPLYQKVIGLDIWENIEHHPHSFSYLDEKIYSGIFTNDVIFALCGGKYFLAYNKNNYNKENTSILKGWRAEEEPSQATSFRWGYYPHVSLDIVIRNSPESIREVLFYNLDLFEYE